MDLLEECTDLGTRRPPTNWVSVAGPLIERAVVKNQRRADLEGGVFLDSTRAAGAQGAQQPQASVHGSYSLRRRDEKHVSRHNRTSKAESIAQQLKMKNEALDTSISWLSPEDEQGAIEYKYKLNNPHPIRLQQLITQMKFRISEGAGQCFYYLGVEDDGYCKGLGTPELDASIGTLEKMAITLQAHATLVHIFPGAHGRRCALLRVQRGTVEEVAYTDLRVAVAGCVDAGKSTLVAVLTHGSGGQPYLDTGRGTARVSVLRHKHEIESGRTSSISQQMLGYDAEGKVLNYAGTSVATLSEVCGAASKVLTFIDMGGHERCLKTALYGLTALLPDYALLCCCAVRGLGHMSREHLAVAVALQVPVAAIITKVDLVDEAALAATVQDVRSLVALAWPPTVHTTTATAGGVDKSDVSSPDMEAVLSRTPLVTDNVAAVEAARRMNPMCEDRADVDGLSSSGMGRFFCPILLVSSVTGRGLDCLHAFLHALGPGQKHFLHAATPGRVASGMAGVSGGMSEAASSADLPALGSILANQEAHAIGHANGNAGAGTPALGGALVAAAVAVANDQGPSGLEDTALQEADEVAISAVVDSGALLTGLADAAADTQQASSEVHFQVDHTFEVPGVGSVVSGMAVSGLIRLGQHLRLGPTPSGGFVSVEITGIQRAHIPVRQVRAGQAATLALKPVPILSLSRKAANAVAGVPDTQNGHSMRRTTAENLSAVHHAAGMGWQNGKGVVESRVAGMSGCESDDEGEEGREGVQGGACWGSTEGEGEDRRGVSREQETAWKAAGTATSRTHESRAAALALSNDATLLNGLTAVMAVTATAAAAPAGVAAAASTAVAGNCSRLQLDGVEGVDVGPDLLELFRMDDDDEAGADIADFTDFGLPASPPALIPPLPESPRARRGGRNRNGNGASACGHGSHNVDSLGLSTGTSAPTGAVSNGAARSPPGLYFQNHTAEKRGAPSRRLQAASWCSRPLAEPDSPLDKRRLDESQKALEACALATSPGPPSFLLSSSPAAHKGVVLLGPGRPADTAWGFEAVLVLLGGHWPARGLVSGCWPPVDNAGIADVEVAAIGVGVDMKRTSPWVGDWSAAGRDQAVANGAGGLPGASSGDLDSSSWCGSQSCSEYEGDMESVIGSSAVSEAQAWRGGRRAVTQLRVPNAATQRRSSWACDGHAPAVASASLKGVRPGALPHTLSSGVVRAGMEEADVRPDVASNRRRHTTVAVPSALADADGTVRLTIAAAGSSVPASPTKQQGNSKGNLRAGGHFTSMIHCANIRQLARLVRMQEVHPDALTCTQQAVLTVATALSSTTTHDPAPALGLPPHVLVTPNMMAAAALLHAPWQPLARQRDALLNGEGLPSPLLTNLGLREAPPPPPPLDEGPAGAGVVGLHSDLGCIIVATFRFEQRPEWMCQGTRLVVRDRSTGHVSAAGYVRRVMVN